jgi:AcrR family transcriptional regulator
MQAENLDLTVQPTLADAPHVPSRRERKKERTRREIYRAAMKLFARRGFDSVTIENICDAADVARGTFFLHFPTKSALLFEYQRVVASAFAERLQGPRISAAGEFRTLVELLTEHWRKDSDVMNAMLREAIRNPATIEAAQKEGRELEHLIEEIVQHGQAVGEFRSDLHPRLAAVVFLSTTSAILSGSAFHEEDEVEHDGLTDQTLELVLGGLTNAPPAKPRRARRK